MRRWQAWLCAVLFAVAYTQPVALYSNQNQYFLHAAAQAGYGELHRDWLANTADPTPLFTFISAVSFRAFGEWPIHVIFFAVLMGYFHLMRTLLRTIGLLPTTAPGDWLFAAIFTLSHSSIARLTSDRLFGADYPWFLQCGVANQYLLGAGLQPSVAGVGLLWALTLFARQQPIRAAAVAAGVNVIHATYLLPAALIVAGIIVTQLYHRQARSALLAGLVALGIVTPIVVMQYLTFRPTSPEQFSHAQDLLANLRLPHHARPDRWFDLAAAGQVLLVVAGMFALRRTRLFLPLSVVCVLALLGTAVVIVSNHPTFSLFFPWRISALLVPLAVAVLIARFIRRATRGMIIAGVVFLGCFLGGVAIYALQLGYREPTSEDRALAYVRATAQPGELYLIPVRFPKPSTARGVYSRSFAQPPGQNEVVSFEFARFRLATRAPVFVDYKAMPYKDTDIEEWHRRVGLCEAWFQNGNWSAETISAMRAEGITHIVVPIAFAIVSDEIEAVADAGAYRIVRVKPTMPEL